MRTAEEGAGEDDTRLLTREIGRTWVALGGRSPAAGIGSHAEQAQKVKDEGETKPRLHVDARRAAQLVCRTLGAMGGVGGGERLFFL